MGRGAVTFKVQLLDDTEYSCELGAKAKASQLLDKVCDNLGVEEKDYFGLRFIDPKDGQYNWIDPLRSLKSQLKKAPPHLYFAVKFYPPNPTGLAEDITRYLFVLQLREDLLKGKLQCSVPIHALLGSYIVQGELGDREECGQGTGYLEDFKFCPNQSQELIEKVAEFHKKHREMTPADAEVNYLDTVRKFPHYGMDMHPAMDAEGEQVQLAISSAGIHVFQENRQINKFVWPKILKISFKSKKFFLKIKPADEDEKSVTVGFILASRRASKRLWKVAVENHAFFRLVTADIPRKAEIIRLGSKFRYSGRTHHQARHNENIWLKNPTAFERVPSKRFSARVLDSNRELEEELAKVEEKKDVEKPVKEKKVEKKDDAPVESEPPVEKAADPEPGQPSEDIQSPKPPEYDEVIMVKKQETVVVTSSTVTERSGTNSEVTEKHTTRTVTTERHVSEEVASSPTSDDTSTPASGGDSE